MNEAIDLSNDPDDEPEVIELTDDGEIESMEIDEEAEEKRRRRRRLKHLLNHSVTPSFIAIISPNYEDHLPKRIRVDFNEHLGLKKTKPRLTLKLPPKPVPVPSFPITPLPKDEGYYEGLVPVAQPDDSKYLNELHMMIRHQLEIFSATDEDVRTTQAGRRTPTIRGKVGVRCIHCAKVALKDSAVKRFWPPGSVSYPVNVEGLYSVCTQKIQLHFEACPYMPEEVKAQLYRLSYDASGNSIRRQNLNNTGHSFISAGNYYLIAAKRIGLQNVPGGIRFGRDLSLDPLSVESVQAEVEAKSNAGKKTSYASQLKVSPADANVTRITADKESEGVLAAAIAESDNDNILGRSDDSKLVSDFVFLCVRQMAYCHVVPADFETRGKKTALMRLGFSGFCCRHCHDINNPETSMMVVDYSCRSFTSAADNLSSAITNSFYVHLQKCDLVPVELRKALAAYKRIHPRQITRLVHGSQRRLFHAIWARLRAVDIPEEEMKERLKNAPKPAPQPTVQPKVEVATEQTSDESEQVTPEQVPSSESIPDQVASGGTGERSTCFPQCDDVETVRLLKATEDNTDYAASDNLILSSDRHLITDFVFFMMRHMRIAIPSAADYAKGRRSTNLNSRLAGFCCKYCHDQDASATITGRSFPSAPDNMASSLNTSLYNHMLRCFYVPDDMKRAIANLKRIHSQQCGNLKFGSQRKFFNLVYTRLKTVEIPHFEIEEHAVVKVEGNNTPSVADDAKLAQSSFLRISPELVECARCRLIPLSLRAPNAVSTSAINRDTLETHKKQCKGGGYYLGNVVDAMSKIMDAYPTVTYDVLERDSFKAIVQELVGEKPLLGMFTSGVLDLVRHKRNTVASGASGVKDPETEQHLGGEQLRDTSFEKVATLFETWVKEVDGVESSLRSNKSFLLYFQLISPSLYEAL